MEKKIIKYTCFRCGKKRQSQNPKKTVCNACKKWTQPGKGQVDIFGFVTK